MVCIVWKAGALILWLLLCRFGVLFGFWLHIPPPTHRTASTATGTILTVVTGLAGAARPIRVTGGGNTRHNRQQAQSKKAEWFHACIIA